MTWKLDKIRGGGAKRFAYDFRPHTCHWALMEQLRNSETESGTIDLAGASVCGFMTTWGDGIFEVFRDFDSAGNPVAVRVDLGSDEAVTRLRYVNDS